MLGEQQINMAADEAGPKRPPKQGPPRQQQQPERQNSRSSSGGRLVAPNQIVDMDSLKAAIQQVGLVTQKTRVSGSGVGGGPMGVLDDNP